MSERVLEGPLDVTRRLAVEAHNMTDLPGLCFAADSTEMAEVRQLLNVIEEEHPLLGDLVEVYGTELVVGRDDNKEYPLMIPDERPGQPKTGRYSRWNIPVKGQYQGLYIMDAYAPEAEGMVTVITHGILRDVVDHFDDYGNLVTIRYMSYVLAEEDVMIKPILPINTHSLQDLRRDPAIVEFDKLVHDPAPNKAEQIRQIGSFANRVFEITDYDDERNLQRASYLNSTRILADVEVFGTDFIYGNREEYISNQANVIYNDPAIGSAQVANAFFDVLPGYTRLARGGIRFLEPPELFVTAHDADGWVGIPAKSILEVI